MRLCLHGPARSVKTNEPAEDSITWQVGQALIYILMQHTLRSTYVCACFAHVRSMWYAVCSMQHGGCIMYVGVCWPSQFWAYSKGAGEEAGKSPISRWLGRDSKLY